MVHIDEENKDEDSVYWICKCDCGNEKSIIGGKLRDGTHTSCGCWKHGVGEKSRTWKGYKDISGKYWNRTIKGAKSRGLEFSLTIDKMWDMFIRQNGKCALTGESISLKNSQTASIDRISSNEGYVYGNVQWTHSRVNILKSNYPEEEFINWCKKISNYHNEKTRKTL